MRILGRIQAHEPWLPGRTRGGRLVIGGLSRIRLIVDTGFTGAIALPSRLLHGLLLDEVGAEPYILADGSAMVARVYEGQVVLGDQVHKTEIICSEGDPLIGMQFIEEVAASLLIDPARRRVVLSTSRPKNREGSAARRR